MDDQNKNLILASALSFLVIIIWFVLFPPPEAPLQPETPALSQEADATDLTLPAGDEPVLNSSPTELTTAETAPRIAIETDRLNGSISLRSTIGLVIGLIFMGPIGIILGSFIGAFSGELLNKTSKRQALKAAFGSLIGFLTGVFLKFSVSLIFFFYFLKIYTSAIF